MAEEKGYGLLISAIVSIVAIVGMVVLFSSGNMTGRAISMQGKSSNTFGWGAEGEDLNIYAFQPGDSPSGIVNYDAGVETYGAQAAFEPGNQRLRENVPCYYAETGKLTCPGTGNGVDSFNSGSPGDVATGERQSPETVQAYGRPLVLQS